jgi:hypothetical protein
MTRPALCLVRLQGPALEQLDVLLKANGHEVNAANRSLFVASCARAYLLCSRGNTPDERLKALSELEFI